MSERYEISLIETWKDELREPFRKNIIRMIIGILFFEVLLLLHEFGHMLMYVLFNYSNPVLLSSMSMNINGFGGIFQASVYISNKFQICMIGFGGLVTTIPFTTKLKCFNWAQTMAIIGCIMYGFIETIITILLVV